MLNRPSSSLAEQFTSAHKPSLFELASHPPESESFQHYVCIFDPQSNLSNNKLPPSVASPRQHIQSPFIDKQQMTIKECVDAEDRHIVTRGRKRKLITKDKLETNTSTSSIRFDKLYSTIRQGGKLSDEHISAACRLLRQQFPDSQGLYTPVLGQNLSFPPVNSILLLAGYSYIQILHTGSDHWVTVSIESEQDVKTYDSMFHSVTYFTKKQIASITRSKSHEIILKMGQTQIQENSLDCGIYAITFATDLCYGEDPSQKKFDKPYKLRMHLIDNLRQQKMEKFPSIKLKRELGYLTEKMSIYCKCRLPYVGEYSHVPSKYRKSDDSQMIQCYTCEEWYHKTCVNLSILSIKQLKKKDAK